MPKPGYTNTPYGPVLTSSLGKGPTVSKKTSQSINALSKMSPAQVKATSQAANAKAVAQAKFAAQSASQQKPFNVAAIKAQTAAQMKQVALNDPINLKASDPKAPWNNGAWAKNDKDPEKRKSYWQTYGWKPSYMKDGDPTSQEVMGAAKTAAYFTPVLGAGLSFGDAASSFEKGDVGGGLVNAALGAVGGLGAVAKGAGKVASEVVSQSKNALAKVTKKIPNTKVAPKKPVGKKPIGKKPTPKKPAPKKPVAKKPGGKKPIGKKPVAKSPVGKGAVDEAIPTAKSVDKNILAPSKGLATLGVTRTIANPGNFMNSTTTSNGFDGEVGVGGAIDTVPQIPEPIKTTTTDDVKVVNPSDFVENYEDTQSDYSADSLTLYNSLSTSEILEVARNYEVDTNSININANILDIVSVVNAFSPTEIVKLQQTSNVYFGSFGENLQKNSSGLAQTPGLAEILVPQKNDNNSYKIQIQILAPKTIQRGTAYPIA